MPENTGKTEKKILVEGWRSKVSEQKRRMKQFLFVVVTACILCGMCVVVLASNPVVSKQGVELAVNPTRAMIAMVFAMFCGIQPRKTFVFQWCSSPKSKYLYWFYMTLMG